MLISALVFFRSDFKELVEAGYRPGYTRVSELDNVVSVAKKVNSLGVPLNALQAWDSDLITGEVVYLVLLMNFGSKYPVREIGVSVLPRADSTNYVVLQVNPDSGTRGEVQFKIGISPKYKPSKTAIAAAFRAHSANTYTSTLSHLIILPGRLLTLLVTSFSQRASFKPSASALPSTRSSRTRSRRSCLRGGVTRAVVGRERSIIVFSPTRARMDSIRRPATMPTRRRRPSRGRTW